MTLSELIVDLIASGQTGVEQPVRFVIRTKDGGSQYECIGVMKTEGLYGPMTLIMAGEEAATMDWPTSIDPDKID